MRSVYIARNIATTLFFQGLNIFVSLVSRKIFLVYLTIEYLGIDSLLSNILFVFSLFEAGVESSVTYSLYKPLAEGDNAKVASLVAFLKKSYRIIGVSIFVAGLCFLPFVGVFFKGVGNIEHLNYYYLIFLLNTSVSYFFSYKRSIIIADQKNYVVNSLHYLFVLPLRLVQILILVLTQSYMLFLLAMLAFTVFENYFIFRKAGKMYPFLDKVEKAKLELGDRVQLKKNMFGVLYTNVGVKLIDVSENLLISFMFGTVWVGYYANYLIIIQALKAVTSQIYGATNSSFGNYVLSNRDTVGQAFKTLNLFTSWMAAFTTISTFILINPVISLWLGKEYCLSATVTLLICLNYFLSAFRRTTALFRDAFGLFWRDKHKNICDLLVRVVLILVFAKFMGLAGVFLAGIVSTLFVGFAIEFFVVCKYGIEYPVLAYIKDIARSFALTAFVGLLTYLPCSYFVFENEIAGIAFKALCCLLIPNLLFLAIFYNTEEFRFFKVRAGVGIKNLFSRGG